MLKSTGFIFMSLLLFVFLINIPAKAQSDTLFYEPFDDMSNWTAAGPLANKTGRLRTVKLSPAVIPLPRSALHGNIFLLVIHTCSPPPLLRAARDTIWS